MGEQRLGGKLVRDRIPEIIRQSGRTPAVSILDAADYREALRAKLVEEVHEFLEADDRAAVEELADVIEVVSALATELGCGFDELLAVAEAKRRDRGGFLQRYWLDPRGAD